MQYFGHLPRAVGRAGNSTTAAAAPAVEAAVAAPAMRKPLLAEFLAAAEPALTKPRWGGLGPPVGDGNHAELYGRPLQHPTCKA